MDHEVDGSHANISHQLCKKYKESQSGPLKQLPGGPASYRFTLVSTAGGWLVDDYMEVQT